LDFDGLARQIEIGARLTSMTKPHPTRPTITFGIATPSQALKLIITGACARFSRILQLCSLPVPLQIPRMVAFGTKADMPLTPVNVRFRRQSGNIGGA
jgi:hypothetical protein